MHQLPKEKKKLPFEYEGNPQISKVASLYSKANV